MGAIANGDLFLNSFLHESDVALQPILLAENKASIHGRMLRV